MAPDAKGDAHIVNLDCQTCTLNDIGPATNASTRAQVLLFGLYREEHRLSGVVIHAVIVGGYPHRTVFGYGETFDLV